MESTYTRKSSLKSLQGVFSSVKYSPLLLLILVSQAHPAERQPTYQLELRDPGKHSRTQVSFDYGYGLAINHKGDVAGTLVSYLGPQERNVTFYWANGSDQNLVIPQAEADLFTCKRPSAIDEQRNIFCEDFVVGLVSGEGKTTLLKPILCSPPETLRTEWNRAEGLRE